MCLVLHVVRVVCLHGVDDNFLWQLHCKSILVDGDLFDVVPASDLYSSFGHQVLDNDICHQLAIGVPLLIQSVDLVKLHFERSESTIVGAGKD